MQFSIERKSFYVPGKENYFRQFNLDPSEYLAQKINVQFGESSDQMEIE